MKKKVVEKYFHNISFRCAENCAVEANSDQGNIASSVKLPWVPEPKNNKKKKMKKERKFFLLSFPLTNFLSFKF